jgi:tetratricopeptide (TPR) repeat protein
MGIEKEMNTNRTIHKIVIIACGLAILAGCSGTIGNAPIIPEYDTAQDQYIYAYDRKMTVRRNILKEENELQADYEKVLKCFERVVERFPEDEQYTPLAYLSIGDTYMKLGKYGKAEDQFDFILKNYIDDDALQSAALLGKASSLSALERYEEARLILRKCIDTYEKSENESVKSYVNKCQRQLLMIESK